MKHFRFFTLTLLAVLAVSAFSGMAVAQNTIKVTFQLDEQLRWGNAVLTPGSYEMTLDSVKSPLRGVIRSADNKIIAMEYATVTSDPISHQSFLQVAGKGSARRVVAMNLGEFGFSAVYSDLTRAEKEEIAKEKKFSGVNVALR